MQRTSPVRIYLAFLFILVGAMLFAAIASPWAQKLLASVNEVPLHRIFSRLMLLGMMAGTTWLIIHCHRDRRALLGFDLPLPQFLQRILPGLLAGFVLMTLAVMPLMLLEVRTWSARAPADGMAWLALALKGLGSGLAVALLEETFFRGAMQGTLQRSGGMRWALFAVPLLYSAVHFLGRDVPVPYETVDAWSGFVVWQGYFSSFAEPLQILDAFAALYFVGLLLALVRQRWGDLAGCIGLHAGFVAVIAVFRRTTMPAPESSWSFLVGPFDGLLGIWIALLTALTCVAVWRWRAVRPAS
jgi:membrane protease YdiL (CAAX protease family)